MAARVLLRNPLKAQPIDEPQGTQFYEMQREALRSLSRFAAAEPLMGWPLKIDGGTYLSPHWIYESGKAAQLSPSATALWTFFHHVANRVSSPCFIVSERMIEEKTGMTAKTIRAARNELVNARLLSYAKLMIAGQPLVYHLLSPIDGEPFPFNGTPGEYGKGERKRAAAEALRNAQQCSTSATRTRRTRSLGSEPHRKETKPQSEPELLPLRDSLRKFTCPVHGDDGDVWVSSDNTVHCGTCETNPYLRAQAETSHAQPTKPLHWDEIRGNSPRTVASFGRSTRAGEGSGLGESFPLFEGESSAR